MTWLLVDKAVEAYLANELSGDRMESGGLAGLLHRRLWLYRLYFANIRRHRKTRPQPLRKEAGGLTWIPR